MFCPGKGVSKAYNDVLCANIISIRQKFCYPCIVIFKQEPEDCQQDESPPSKTQLLPERGPTPHNRPYVAGKKNKFGGYDCKFVKQPPSAFQTECPVCRLLLCDPYQAICCGTSFCHSCSEQVRSDNNLCPTCRKDNFTVFPNKGLKRSLNQLHVLCIHSKNGCKWRGELGELDHHLSQVIHSGKSF